MLEGDTEVTALLEPCGDAEHPDCGIRDVLDRIGDKWSVLVIVELASGTRRFRELQRAIDGLSQRMLTLTVLLGDACRRGEPIHAIRAHLRDFGAGPAGLAESSNLPGSLN